MSQAWSSWIDRGGTFTDCIARDPLGRIHTTKRLSSDRAPVEAIQSVLERAGAWQRGEPLPACSVRLGTTVATNALLTRCGARTLLVANRGLGDVLTIGTQERPDLFDLEIRKPPPLHERVLEVAGRLAADGTELEPLEEEATREALLAARREGLHSVAILLVHAYRDPRHERRLAELAGEAGFPYVVTSSEIAREMGLLARGET